jgi:hypothetical protein
MISVDLHVHTFYSGDAHIPPKLIVEELHAHPLLKAAAITDHDTIRGYFEVCRLASTYKDIMVIPGVELSTFEGHLTVLGVTEIPSQPLSLEEAIDFTRANDAVIVVAHPYRVMGIGDLARNIDADAVETYNGRSASRENKLAEELARVLNLPGVGGSDAHRKEQLWMAYTEIDASMNVDDVLNAIKHGKVRAVMSKSRQVY